MSIQFTCPKCGKQTVVADQFAGQTGPCSACGAAVTIPMGAGFSGPTNKSSSGGATVLIIVLASLAVVGFLCAGLAVALLLPAVNAGRQAARRQQSMNNMRMLGLALHQYHDTYRTLPPAVVTDAEGKPLYSGRVLLLPFLEQGNIYQQFDKEKAWDSPENSALTSRPVIPFQDPANANGSPVRCDLVFVTGSGTAFDGKKGTKIHDMRDGSSNTLMVICSDKGPANWAEPTDWNVDSVAPPTPGANNPAQDKILVLFGDASVRIMRGDYFRQNMRALVSRNGGEVMPPEQ